MTQNSLKLLSDKCPDLAGLACLAYIHEVIISDLKYHLK